MYLIQGMRKAGIALEHKLDNIGLRIDDLDPTSIIHPSLEYDVLKVVGEGVAPEKGILIGQHYALAGYGPLLMLLVTSPTVRDALIHGIRFQQLTHLTGEMSFKQAGHRIALCYCPSNVQDQLGQLVAQA